MASTAGRWTPPQIAAGDVSTITTGAMIATFTAAITANKPAAAQLCWKWSYLSPFERSPCPPSHQWPIACRARRRYIWWVHLPVLHVVFVELCRDGPYRPRTLLRLADLLHACCCRALMHVPLRAATLSLSL